MINKSKLALITVVATISSGSPALAQAFDNSIGTGNPLPMIYDGQGAVHRYVYGYYGPLTPPITPENDSCSLDRLRFRTRLSPIKAASNLGPIPLTGA
jgi:hypothetical protein